MRHSLFKKALCLFFSAVLILAAIPAVPLILPISAAPTATPYVSSEGLEGRVSISGKSAGAQPMSDMDVVAMQMVLTADVLAISTNVPSYSNNTGSVTMALFAFDTDYDTSLLSAPLAEHTFVDFEDSATLAFLYDEADPLPAGEYLLVLYDMKDPTPTANGGTDTGIGMWIHAAFEGQRAYLNGSYLADVTYSLSVVYASTPETPYGIPTKPAADENLDLAPLMSAVLDFRTANGKSALGGANQSKATFMTEGDESFTRLAANQDAGDPYQFINFPDTIIKCNEYKYALLKIRRSEGSSLKSQLFFITDEVKINEAASVRPTYQDTTDWQYVVINLGANNNYKGLLKSLRLDYFQSCKGNQYVDLQYIALFKTQEAAEAFHDNFEDFKNETEGEGGTNVEEKPDYSTYISADAPAESVEGKLTANGALGYLYKNYPYSMSFEKSPEEYMSEGYFAFSAIDNAIVHNGRLQCKAFSSYEFYTKKFLGDNYGIRGGALTFVMTLESGTISVTLRQIKPNDNFTYSGIRFELASDGSLTVSERDGLTDTVKLNLDLTAEHTYTFADNGSTLSLIVDGTAVYTLIWDSNALTLTTPAGKSYAAIHVPNAGYASFRATRTRGYVDDVTYTYTDIVPKTVTGDHPVDYSTWVATDDLGRTTPTFAQVGE